MDTFAGKLRQVSVKGWLWTIIGLGLVARLGAVLLMGDTVEVLPGIYDQVSYHTLATRLLDGNGFTFASDWWPATRAGEPTAHWSYLYTIYIAVVYTLVGEHPLVARILQAGLVGVAMPWLAFRLAVTLVPSPDSSGSQEIPISCCSSARRKKDLVGLTAAGWVAFYGYFIYYSAALMTESFYISAILWSLACSIHLAHSQQIVKSREYWKKFASLGIAMGTAVLLRQVFLVFVPFLLAWLVFNPGTSTDRGWGFGHSGHYPASADKPPTPGISTQEKQSRWKGVVISTAIMAVMILPFTLWNYHQFGRFVLLNTNAGYAFFWANHPVHGNDFVPLFTADMPTYQELIPQELRSLDEAALEKELLRLGVGFVLDNPGRFFRLSLSRIDDHFIFWPKPDSSLLSNITRVLSIGVALPFMLWGMGWWFVRASERQERVRLPRLGWILAQPGGLLLLFFAVYVGAHLLSWAGIRYRLPADTVALIFAAYALVHIVQLIFRHYENSLFD